MDSVPNYLGSLHAQAWNPSLPANSAIIHNMSKKEEEQISLDILKHLEN
jgi:hypothetical protein